jgi:gamma-glutamylcyclotransferase
MNYFAYGSNMCLSRLMDRILDVKVISVGKLSNHKLLFNKRSIKDSSGKANAFFTANSCDCIFGVIYEIEKYQKDKLDICEGVGKGYFKKEVSLILQNDKNIEAITYIADDNYIDNTLLPYSWYLEYLVVGAIDFNLPSYYIEKIKQTKTIIDYDKIRLQDFDRIITLHKNNKYPNR